MMQGAAMTVEICVQGIESALAAEMGGADRVELCENLAVGGVTPSAGIVAVACRRLRIPVHVLIRPRGGAFRYTEPEFAAMQHDIAAIRALGAAGVVIGVLNEQRSVDIERTAELVAAAGPMAVTFHKAFDETADPFASFDALVALGIDRLLTSGCATTAISGLSTLAALVSRASNRIGIMAGGRIREEDVAALAAAGVREIHVGSAAGTEGQTDPHKVRRIVDAAHAWASG